MQPARLIDGTQEVGSQAHRPQDVGDVPLRRCSLQLTVDVGDLTRCLVVLDPRDPSHHVPPPKGLGRAYHHPISVEEADPMFTLTMRFTLPEDTDWSTIPALMEDRARNLYVNMPGLISKAFVYDPDTR